MDSSTTSNPFTAQREFVHGQAVVVAEDKAVVVVSGPDRLVWLNSLLTQDVLSLTPGMTIESLLLDPNGRIEHAFLMSDDGDSTWLLVDTTHRDALEAWLESMKFRMDVSVSSPTDSMIIGRHGPIAPITALGIPRMSWRDPWPSVAEGSFGYHEGAHPGDGLALVYEHYEGVDVGALSKTRLVALEARDALLIAAGRPTLDDVDEKSLPHEYDWLRTAVHMNKGCYRGQETVAKVHNLGHPPRRMVLLHLDGSDSVLPEPEAEVFLGENSVGFITRRVRHFELGPIAIALLKRTTDPNAVLSVSSREGVIPATQEILVPIEAGATRSIPRLPRL